MPERNPTDEGSAEPKKKKTSWVKTALSSAALAIVAWEAVRFYRKLRTPNEVDRNPALPPSPQQDMGRGIQGSPFMPLPIPYPFPGYAPAAPAAPAAAPAPVRNTAHSFTAKELAAMLKKQRAAEREERLQAAEMELD